MEDMCVFLENISCRRKSISQTKEENKMFEKKAHIKYVDNVGVFKDCNGVI